MFHSDNVYDIPNVRINGKVCLTNFTSHTAFRGFGGPQGMLITENWMQRIATELKKSPEEIRVSHMLFIFCSSNCFHSYVYFLFFYSPFSYFSSIIDIYEIALSQEINFQSEGCVTHYGQQLQQFTLPRLWNELKSSCELLNARDKVDLFNLQNRWTKRGIAMVPTKFGISFTAKFMNQVIFETNGPIVPLSDWCFYNLQRTIIYGSQIFQC